MLRRKLCRVKFSSFFYFMLKEITGVSLLHVVPGRELYTLILGLIACPSDFEAECLVMFQERLILFFCRKS